MESREIIAAGPHCDARVMSFSCWQVVIVSSSEPENTAHPFPPITSMTYVVIRCLITNKRKAR